MRGKHAAPPAGPLRPVHDLHRRTLGNVDPRAQAVAAGALVVAITVAIIGAFTINRTPARAPLVPVAPIGALGPPSSAPAPSESSVAAERTAEPLPTRTERTAAAPRPRPTAPRTPESGPVGGLTARYVVSGSWDTGFVAGVVVFNPTAEEQTWRVEISHAAAEQVAVATHWNADITRSGSYVVFAGGPLPPGGMQTFGFEATKKPAGKVRPSGCTVNGTPCEIPE